MKVIVLNEAVHENHLYHYTNVNGLIGIINSDKLYGNPETKGFLKGIHTISFSRRGAGKTVDPEMINNNMVVKMVFDRDKLKNNNKFISFNYADNLKTLQKGQKARDKESRRGKGKSEYEEACVLGKTQEVYEINDVYRGSLGKVYIDSGLNIVKVTDDEGTEMKMFQYVNDWRPRYQLQDGYYYIFEVQRETDGLSGYITEINLKIELDYDLSYMEATENLDEEDEDYQNEIEFIEDELSNAQIEEIPIEITNTAKYIQGVANKLVEVQLSKKLYDLVFNNIDDRWISNELTGTLYSETTDGLNGDATKQRTINHDIRTIKKFKEFLDSLIKKGIKVSYYNYSR